MKRTFELLSILVLSLCLTVSAFASSDTRTGDVVGGGSNTASVGTQNASGNNSGWGNGNSVNSGGVTLTDPNVTQDYINNELFGGHGVITPNVTTGTIISRLEAKGNDIVSILQIIGKYVCIAGFIICCILTIIGIIGNKRLLVGAIIGLFISGLAYAGIVCGREIVNWVAAWAAS